MLRRDSRDIKRSRTITIPNADDGDDEKQPGDGTRSHSSDSIDIYIKNDPDDVHQNCYWMSRRIATRNVIDVNDRTMTMSWGRLYMTPVKPVVTDACYINDRSARNEFTMTLDGTCGIRLGLVAEMCAIKQKQGFVLTVAFTPQRSIANEIKDFTGDQEPIANQFFMELGILVKTMYIQIRSIPTSVLEIICMRQGSCMNNVLSVGDYIVSVDNLAVTTHSLELILSHRRCVPIQYVKRYTDTVRQFNAGNVCFHERTYSDSMMSVNRTGVHLPKVVAAYIDLLNTDDRMKPHKTHILAQLNNANMCRSYLIEDELPHLTHTSSYIHNAKRFRECRLLQYGTHNSVFYNSHEMYPESHGDPSTFFSTDTPADNHCVHTGHKKTDHLQHTRRLHMNTQRHHNTSTQH